MTTRDDLAEGRGLAWRRLRLLIRGTRWLIILAVALVMLALNVATLTLSGVNALASAAISALTSLDPVSSSERRARLAAEEAAEEARLVAGRASSEGADLRAQRDSLVGQVEAEESRRVRVERDLGVARADLADMSNEAADLRLARNGLAGQVDTLTADVADGRAEARGLRASLEAAEAAQWVELGGERLSMREAVARTTAGVRDRTARVATANLGSMVGESVPFYGIAVVVAATTFELASACQSMQDMHDLEVALGVAAANDAQVAEVCGLQVPTRAELWAMIRNSPGAAWDGAAGALSALGEVELPRPDFSGRWARTVAWVGSWFED